MEISGDGKLSLFRRVEYLWRNAARNIFAPGDTPATEHFRANRLISADCSSPGRLLTEFHLRSFLPSVLSVGRVRVLDIGCGSGRMCQILAEMGYSGEYVGLDVYDRFGTQSIPGFERRLVLGDARDFDALGSKFDLVISMSALEHIPDERQLLDRLPSLLSPTGIELHYVPSGWGLPVYLWHGYRQYPLRYVSTAFGGSGVRVFAFGGLFSFLLHFSLITVGEMILRLPVRRLVPSIYRRLLRVALVCDSFARICPTMFAVARIVRIETGITGAGQLAKIDDKCTDI